MSAFDEDDESDFTDDIEFSFELLNSADGLIITLACISSKEMLPDEYAKALRDYADRIESIMSMAEVSTTLN